MSDSWMERQQEAVLGASAPPGSTATAGARGGEPGTAPMSGWTGWVVFAGLMMIVAGCFQAIEGLTALFRDRYFVVRPSGLIIHVDYTAWGWTHLVIGAVAVVVGAGLLKGNAAARVAGVVIAVLSAIVNLAFLAAAPVWSTIVIAVDVLVVYAIVVHGGELRAMRRRSS